MLNGGGNHHRHCHHHQILPTLCVQTDRHCTIKQTQTLRSVLSCRGPLSLDTGEHTHTHTGTLAHTCGNSRRRTKADEDLWSTAAAGTVECRRLTAKANSIAVAPSPEPNALHHHHHRISLVKLIYTSRSSQQTQLIIWPLTHTHRKKGGKRKERNRQKTKCFSNTLPHFVIPFTDTLLLLLLPTPPFLYSPFPSPCSLLNSFIRC